MGEDVFLLVPCVWIWLGIVDRVFGTTLLGLMNGLNSVIDELLGKVPTDAITFIGLSIAVDKIEGAYSRSSVSHHDGGETHKAHPHRPVVARVSIAPWA